MPKTDAMLDLAESYELCIWLWTSSSEYLTVSTECDCWMVRATGAGGTTYYSVPTRDDSMPDFDHPRWPAVRKALSRLRRAEG